MQQETGYQHHPEPTMRKAKEARRERSMSDHLRAYRERYKEALISMAASARDKAVSHRAKPFEVGSAALIVNSESAKDAEYEVYASHNWTPTPGKRVGGDKRCAERNALDAALLANNRGLVIAITTVSRETSTGDETAHDVLHPCQECRTLMRQLIAQGNLREDSVICSINDANPTDESPMVIEEKTIKEVLDLYKNDQSFGADTARKEQAA